MAKQSRGQKKTMERVMHEFKHGELKSGPQGHGGKVRSRRQAIAIALNEAGASKYESKAENERSYRRTKQKEARGETALAETEGRKSLPDSPRRRSATRKTASNRSGTRKTTATRRKTAATGKKAAARKPAASRARSSGRRTASGRSAKRK